MKLFSWNVNGIRAVLNKGALQDFLDKYQPDILCLQETKANKDQVEVDFEDYVETWNSAERKGYAGTAIFSRQKPLQIIQNIPDKIAKKYILEDDYGNSNKEGRVLATEFDNFWVATSYTPNTKGDLSRLSLREKAWDPAFLEFMLELQESKPVLFCGDLNVAHQEIDLARPTENVGKHGFTNEERAGFDKILKSGFVDTFRQSNPDREAAYTWWTNWGGARARNVGWRIDYWLASQKLSDQINSAQIHPEVMGSDHCPVSIEV
jgi:exodeoxyribonuclease-3